MASTIPQGIGPPPSLPSSSNDAPLSWEGDKMFNIYIHDYCSKRGFKKTAWELQQEAEILPDAKPPINARQGLLFEWWSVFWVLFSAKNGNGTEDATLYYQNQANQTMQRQLQQQRMQPPTQGSLAGAPVGPPQQRLTNGPMGQRLGPTFPMNGPMPNGVASVPGQIPPGSVPLPNLGGPGPQPNGIPGSGPPQTPGSTPALAQSFPPLIPNQRSIGAHSGSQQSPQPPQSVLQQRQSGPFQRSPTITNSPQAAHGQAQQQQQSAPQQQSQQPPQHHTQPPPMGQLGVSSPHMQHLNRTMLPPGLNSLNPQQPGNAPNPPFPQLGRPPSRTNTPSGQGTVMHPSPSLSARQTPGNQEILDVRQIPTPILLALKQELGLNRDISQMTPAEKSRLIAIYHQRGGRKLDGAGPVASIQPPNVQLRGPPPQQPQQRLKRSSTTPEEQHEGTRTDSSPPQKRPRPSPEQAPMQGMGYPPQQPQGPPGPQPGQSSIPMSGQSSLTMLRGPMAGGVTQGGQPPMGNHMNMNISHSPLGGSQLIGGIALNPHGHQGQSGLMAQQLHLRQMQNHQAHNFQGMKGPMPPQGMNPTIQGPGNNTTPSSAHPTTHPGAPGASSGPQFRLPPQNKSMSMMPPAQNGANKDPGGNKDIKTEDIPRNLGGQTPNTSGTAPPTPAPGVTNIPTNQGSQGPTPVANGAPNTNIAPSPSSILGTPLNPGPMVNQQSVLTDTLFPSDFMQHLSNSLEDFDTSMFRADGDINFERDFGQWFSPDVNDVHLEMK